MLSDDNSELKQDRPRSPLKEEELGQRLGRWVERDAAKAESAEQPEMSDLAAITVMMEGLINGAGQKQSAMMESLVAGAEQRQSVLLARVEADMHANVTNAMAPFTAQLNQVKTQVTDHETRLVAVEDKMAEWERRLKERETEAELTVKKGEEMQRKVSALDDNGRRNNWRCPNLPAGLEGDSAMDFAVRMLPAWFPALQKFNFPMTVDRAHRVQVRDPNALQPFICRMMSHQATRAILQLSKKNPPRMRDAAGNWVKLRFYSDYGPITVQKRAEFKGVMAELWERDIKHFLQYPAVLKIQDGNDRLTCNTLLEAQEFIRSNKPKTSRSRSPTLPPTPQKTKKQRSDARRSRSSSPQNVGEGMETELHLDG